MRRLLPVVVAIALLASGCGGADGSLFATAVRSTQDAGGAEVVFQGTVDAPGETGSVTMSGTGLMDAKEERGQITMDVPGGGQLEVRQDHLVMYMRSALFANALGGREWMKIDIARATRS